MLQKYFNKSLELSQLCYYLCSTISSLLFNLKYLTYKNLSIMCYPFKLIIAVILLTALVCELCSCSNKHYSPLDSYIDATIQRSADSTKHVKEVNQFLDSINHK